MSRSLTAMFERRVQAEAARNALVAASIAPNRIRIHAGSAPAPHEGGLWTEMLGMLVPEEDRQVMHEGVGRGGAVLTVEVEDQEVDAATRILECARPAEVAGRTVVSHSPAPSRAASWDDEDDE